MRVSISKQGALGWVIKRADYLALQARSSKISHAPDKDSQNKHYNTPFFTIQVRPLADLAEPGNLRWRVGLTTSKRVGNAVVRNRARRRLRDLARRHLPDLMQPGYDLVLIGRTPAAVAPFPLLVAHLTLALDKLRLRRKADA